MSTSLDIVRTNKNLIYFKFQQEQLLNVLCLQRIWIVGGPCEGRTHMLGEGLMRDKDGTFLEHMVHIELSWII